MTTESPLAKLPAIAKLAEVFDLDAQAFIYTFRTVAMPQPHTDAEFVSCCLVAREHGLNPLTKEIYFMRTKAGQIQPIVAVDGWIKKCNEHPQYDGMEIIDTNDDKGNPISATISIFRKDRTRPTKITEYFDECSKAGGPVWKTSPHRMMRNRVICQGARIAFGFAGIMERDEFDQWQSSMKDVTPATTTPVTMDIPDIPDEPVIDQAAVLREIERALDTKAPSAVEQEYTTVIMAMDEDGRAAALEMIQLSKGQEAAQ